MAEKCIIQKKKLDLLNKFKQIQGNFVELMKTGRRAIVFDDSVFINALANRKTKMIVEFCYKNVYEKISRKSKGCARVDIVTDSYSDRINLKEMTQHCAGIGMHVEFDNNTSLPIEFASDFLKFYCYLVELMLQKYQFHGKDVVATKK